MAAAFPTRDVWKHKLTILAAYWIVLEAVAWLASSAALIWAAEPPRPPLFDPLPGADERIARIRCGEVKIEVRDAEGRPVAGARVEVKQKRHAFLFGSNIFTWANPDKNREAAYRERFAELLNYATLPFYWWSYEAEQGRPQHDKSQQIAQWCREYGVATKGHPLMWNYAEPRWLPDDLAAVRRLQLARIDDCVRRFQGLIDRWDVVNEAVHFDREQCLQRAPRLSAVWKEAGRVEWTRECFVAARRANPAATLLINDYRTDPPYERLIEQLVDDQGKPLYDAIGIQSHMHGGAWPPQRVWRECEDYKRFNAPLHFTEATILSGERRWEEHRGTPWPSTPEGERYQAEEVVKFYTTLFSHPSVEAITWWDFADFRAWKGAPAGLLRADMSPKPAYHELFKLIKGKWWTERECTTDAQGSATLRAFFGDYEVVVTAGDKKATTAQTAVKGAANVWRVELR